MLDGRRDFEIATDLQSRKVFDFVVPWDRRVPPVPAIHEHRMATSVLARQGAVGFENQFEGLFQVLAGLLESIP